jgi:hypothetical protein
LLGSRAGAGCPGVGRVVGCIGISRTPYLSSFLNASIVRPASTTRPPIVEAFTRLLRGIEMIDARKLGDA